MNKIISWEDIAMIFFLLYLMLTLFDFLGGSNGED